MDSSHCCGCHEVSTAKFDGSASQQSVSQDSDKKRRLNSYVMEQFTIVGSHDGKDRAICKDCENACVIDAGKYGTAMLRRHLLICKKQSEFDYIGESSGDHAEGIDYGYFRHMTTTAIIYHELPFCFVEYEYFRDLWRYLKAEFELRSREDALAAACDFYTAREGGIDYGYVRYLIIMAIIHHDLPFSFVGYEKLQELWHYLNPDFEFINKETVFADVRKFYAAQKEVLKLALTEIPSRVCLTSDTWITRTGEGYFCLAAHYVDEDWTSNSKMLSFIPTDYPHSDVEFAEKMLSILKDWGIEKRIFSLTLDNSEANDNLDSILKEQLCLQDSLLCGGEFFNVKSCAYLLDCMVHEALTLVGDVLIKIRASIMYVKRSEERTKLFRDFVQQVDTESRVALSLDWPNRWVSTYTMLRGAVTHRAAFDDLQSRDENYKSFATHAEWSSVEQICKFLEPFYGMANLFSGSSYATSNVCFMEVWQIGCFLKESMENEDEVIKEMACKMHIKFTEYWDQHSVILAMGAAFDPRMKLEILELCFSKLDPSTCREKLDTVKGKLHVLFEQYMNRSTTTGSLSENANETDKGLSTFEVLITYEKQRTHKEDVKSLLEMYLEEDARLLMKYHYSMDVLHYWRDHREQYGVLAYMACDLLSIPFITTSAVVVHSLNTGTVFFLRAPQPSFVPATGYLVMQSLTM